jgi:hypothetical protein
MRGLDRLLGSLSSSSHRTFACRPFFFSVEYARQAQGGFIDLAHPHEACQPGVKNVTQRTPHLAHRH